MSLTDRDRKVLLVIVPLIVLVGYWFLLLAPKRDEATKAAADLTEQKEARDEARTQLATLESAKTSFAADYAQIVRLGKAIPSSVDMPSLLVQLDTAARGTGIKFTKAAAGDREAAPAPQPAGSSAGGSAGKGAAPAAGSSGTAPAAGGGAPAQSTPGQAGESAAENVDSANGQNQAGAQDPSAKDAQTSQPAKGGKLPVGGGAGAAAAGGPAAAGACSAGLECVPLEFQFDGRFFELADFFHRLKRFVEVANDKVLVRGRLLTIDGLRFSSGDEFPRLKAEIKATVYLAPKEQGQTAGATTQGPAAAAGSTAPGSAAPGAGAPQPASSGTP